MYFNFRKCNVVSLRVFVPWKGSGFTSKKYLNNSKRNMKFIAKKVSLITVQLDYHGKGVKSISTTAKKI